jgi:hypothetical protein
MIAGSAEILEEFAGAAAGRVGCGKRSDELLFVWMITGTPNLQLLNPF